MMILIKWAITASTTTVNEKIAYLAAHIEGFDELSVNVVHQHIAILHADNQLLFACPAHANHSILPSLQ